MDAVALLVTVCCLGCWGIFPVVYLIAWIIKVSHINTKGEDLPSGLERVWYRSLLLTPNGMVLLLFTLMALSCALVSVDFAVLATPAVFFGAILLSIWGYALAQNLRVSLQNRNSKALINSHLQLSRVEEGSSIKSSIELKLPVLPGFVQKLQVLIPRRLGEDVRQVGLKEGKLEIVPDYSLRGVYKLGPVLVEYTDLFGVTNIQLIHEMSDQLTILPKVRQIKQFTWQSVSNRISDKLARKRLVNTEELYDTRKYNRGDDIRRVNWKVSGRLMAQAMAGNSADDGSTAALNTDISQSMVLRRPEITMVDIRDVVVVLDNVLPAVLTSYALSPAGRDALDKMVAITASLLDFASRYNSGLLLRYFDSRGGQLEFELRGKTRLQWLELLAGINWTTFPGHLPKAGAGGSTAGGASGSAAAGASGGATTSGNTATGAEGLLITAETSLPRLGYMLDKLQAVQGNAQVIYTDIASYLEYSGLQKTVPKSFLRRLGSIVFAQNGYAQQQASGDNWKRMFTKRVKDPHYLQTKLQVDKAISYLRAKTSSVKVAGQKTDHVKLLEGKEEF